MRSRPGPPVTAHCPQLAGRGLAVHWVLSSVQAADPATFGREQRVLCVQGGPAAQRCACWPTPITASGSVPRQKELSQQQFVRLHTPPCDGLNLKASAELHVLLCSAQGRVSDPHSRCSGHASFKAADCCWAGQLQASHIHVEEKIEAGGTAGEAFLRSKRPCSHQAGGKARHYHAAGPDKPAAYL